MSCVLCLEKYIAYDLMKLTDCGHMYHNYCFLKYNNKQCSICRSYIERTTNFCFSTETDTNIIDPTPEQFKNLVVFNKSNVALVEYKSDKEAIQIQKELLIKHQKLFEKFVKENIIDFRYNILRDSTRGNSCSTIYSCSFHENYNGLAMLYVLKGTKKEGLDFFKRRDISSVVELIQREFPYFNVVVVSDHLLKKNLIKIYF